MVSSTRTIVPWSRTRSVALVALASLSPVPVAQSIFEDVSDPLGLVFQHAPGSGTFGLSGGAAWADLDADGDDDLFLVSGDALHGLWRNDAGALIDVVAASGLTGEGFNALGVSAADYDQDGLVDLYLTVAGPNRLFHNEGALGFEDRAPALGIDAPSWSTGASWADFDLDGDLDLYVGNNIESLSFPYHVGSRNNLFVNEGAASGIPFVDRAEALGVDVSGVFGPFEDPFLLQFVGPAPVGDPTAGCTLSVATLDFDEDGDPDLAVGNDFGPFVIPDRLFRNDLSAGSLAFTDVTSATGFDQLPIYNMGISSADYDHDGDWDFYMSNLGDNTFLRNDGGTFTDVAHQAGPVEGLHTDGVSLLTSWGSAWADFDHDGWEDLFVVNGFIPAAFFLSNHIAQPDSLWRNLGNGTFERVPDPLMGAASPAVGRGVAVSDFDGDGWMDLVVVNNGAFIANPETRSRIYRNRASTLPGSGSFLKLRLRGTESNLEGIGASIDVTAGGDRWKRQVLADPVYLSSSTRVVHVGLGEHPACDVVIRWPAGGVQRLEGVPAGSDVVVREPRVRKARMRLVGPR